MADLSKIKLNNTIYNFKDSLTREYIPYIISFYLNDQEEWECDKTLTEIGNIFDEIDNNYIENKHLVLVSVGGRLYTINNMDIAWDENIVSSAFFNLFHYDYDNASVVSRGPVKVKFETITQCYLM